MSRYLTSDLVRATLILSLGCVQACASDSVLGEADADTEVGRADARDASDAQQANLCEDGVVSGVETDTDCGGGECPRCGLGSPCRTDRDCLSGLCDSARCVPVTCGDGELGSDETDADCGGELCAPCEVGERCLLPSDCASGLCSQAEGTCTAPSCDDALRNGEESDVDCGGGQCPSCMDRFECRSDADCASRYCRATDSTCRQPACDDTIPNGTETGVDCGGLCDPCALGSGCAVDSDCLAGFCHPEDLACFEPTCDDGFQNGAEPEVDCGGGCLGCGLDAACAEDADCATFFCHPIDATCDGSSFEWVPSAWSSCSAPCDGGTHERGLEACERTTEVGIDTVAVEHCDDVETPPLTEDCNTEPCTYSWDTSSWSSCSVSCGGGTRTRDVWCKRDADGAAMNASFCSVTTAPSSSDTCNTQSCCTTDPLNQSDRSCTGGTSDIIAWVQFHYGLDDGSAANRTQCQNQCTAWAISTGTNSWCCDLAEDSTTGQSWSCAIHSTATTKSRTGTNIIGSYAGLGRCQ